MRPLHQIEPPGRPQTRRDMPLLVRKLVQRHAEDLREAARLRPAGQKARHIRAFDRTRPGADADGGHVPNVHGRTQRVHQLRQALDVRKQRVGLPQPKLSRLHVQKA